MAAKRIAATIWEKPKASSAKWKMDVRAASPRKLFRALHDFLDDLGYAHEYEPLKAERDAIGDVAIFKSELVGRKDCPTRDGLRLVLGILLLLTIALVPLAIRLLKTSGYLVRTIVRIGVEGEAYRARLGVQGADEQEVINVVSDARVTLDIRSGVAEGDCEISSPIKKKRELARTAEEEEKLKKALGELLSGMPSPAAGVPKVFLP